MCGKEREDEMREADFDRERRDRVNISISDSFYFPLCILNICIYCLP